MALKTLFSQSKSKYFSTYRSKISNDLVVSASMGWSGIEPKTHNEHFLTLKCTNSQLKLELNIFQQSEIEVPLKTLDKADFCIEK